MKIKCPACSAVLNIPETAAGKVVKCPCGKQLRAPGGAAKPAAPAAARPAAAANPNRAPAPQRPAAGRPAPQPSSPSMGDFDPAMFDELTDDDLKQPVLPVSRPGVARGPAPGGGGGMNPYAVGAGGAMPSRSSGNIASVGQRITGALVDAAYYMVTSIPGIIAIIMSAPAEGGGKPSGAAMLGLILGFILLLIPYLVNAILISMSGQTVGKKVAKTRIVDANTGATSGFLQGVLMRNVVFAFLTGIPFIGTLISLADVVYLFIDNHQTVHDKLAQTIVVEA